MVMFTKVVTKKSRMGKNTAATDAQAMDQIRLATMRKRQTLLKVAQEIQRRKKNTP
jgi:AmiR/NasT family two-component response regulator